MAELAQIFTTICLPVLAAMGLGWLLPVLVACALAAAWDRVRPCPPAHAAH